MTQASNSDGKVKHPPVDKNGNVLQVGDYVKAPLVSPPDWLGMITSAESGGLVYAREVGRGDSECGYGGRNFVRVHPEDLKPRDMNLIIFDNARRLTSIERHLESIARRFTAIETHLASADKAAKTAKS